MLFRTDFEGEGFALGVQLVWDWRLARVYDGEGQIIDECIWEQSRGLGLVVERLSLLMNERMTDEAHTLSNRFPEAQATPVTSIDSWPKLTEEESEVLQEATIKLAEWGVADAANNPDRRLEHLVQGLKEARTSHNTHESRMIEWVGLFLPGLDLDHRREEIVSAVSLSKNLDDLANHLDIPSTDVEPSDAEWSAVTLFAANVQQSTSLIESMEAAVKEISRVHLPSLSLLLGPLLAAKLCSAAHGRERLARLPAGTIQVLGAENAFFSHLRQGTPPPKHGYIFQHPWICKSPKWTRGSIARMLAGKAAIAVRVDCFGGEPWDAKQVITVEKKVGEIRKRRSRS